MNRALLSKELSALRPMVWCIWGLFGFFMIFLLATELPDAQPFKPELWVNESHDGTFTFLLIFALMLGAGLLIRESDEGTLSFLDGLPLTRTRLFFMKTLAAFLVLCSVPALGLAADVVFGWLSRSSVDGPLPWRFAFVITGLQMVAGLFLLSAAMAISFTRGWFALVAGLLFWVYLWFRQAGADWLAYIDPHGLLAPDLVKGQVVIPWPRIGAHLGVSAVCLLLAWLAFHHLGDRALRLSQQAHRHLLLRIAGTCLKLAAPVVWVAAIVYLVKDQTQEEMDRQATPVGEEAYARHETKRYEFLYRTSQATEARELFRSADEVHDQVRDLLTAAPAPGRLVVDLASPVAPHAAGQTNWTKIRMPLTPGQEAGERRLILGHETVHVYIEQLGNGRLSAHFASIRSLHEGLATHVAETLFGTEEEKEQRRRAVAGAWSRGKVPLALLVDDVALQKQREPFVVYPLGAELAGALVRTHGADAPARLLRAMGRPGAPAKLAGAAFWRDAMQHAGLDFERLSAAYEQACTEIANEEQEFTASLPKLTAEVKLQGEEIVLRPAFTGDAPGQVVCLVEDDSPFSMGVQSLPRGKDGTFTLARSRHLKATLRYLLGWRTPETEMPVFEAWREAAL